LRAAGIASGGPSHADFSISQLSLRSSQSNTRLHCGHPDGSLAVLMISALRPVCVMVAFAEDSLQNKALQTFRAGTSPKLAPFAAAVAAAKNLLRTFS
jgi:hypothetical protein